MTTASAPYTLRGPCPHCPFRCDAPPYLRPGRAREIAASLRASGEFPCHQTTTLADTDDGGSERIRTSRERQCAGALIISEKSGTVGQVTRIAQRLGLYDPSLLDMDAPVYPSLDAWVAAHTPPGQSAAYVHCGVAADGCTDPAGYRGPSGAYRNEEPGTCDPDSDVCGSCGRTMCASCRATPNDDPDDGPLCTVCYGEGEGA